jgi:hypothetical protein
MAEAPTSNPVETATEVVAQKVETVHGDPYGAGDVQDGKEGVKLLKIAGPVEIPRMLSEEEGEKQKMENAAVKIQTAVRGKRARAEVKHRKYRTPQKKRGRSAQSPGPNVEIRPPLELNNSYGIDLSVYSRLWIRDPDVVPLMSQGRLLRVPHTIVFMHGAPTAWYFTSRENQAYLRRKKKKVNPGEIIKHFEKRHNRLEQSCGHSIVAVWMQNAADSGNKVRKFLTFEDVRKMVLNGGGYSRSLGILQEFVDVGSDRRQTVQVDWTCHIKQVELCESRHRVRNQSATLEQRLTDFDSNEGDLHKQRIPDTSKKGVLHLGFSDSIAKRLETIANMANGGLLGRFPEGSTSGPSQPLTSFLSLNPSYSQQRPFLSIRLHRAVFNFTVGKDGCNYFTHCSFLDIGDKILAGQVKGTNASGFYSSSAEINALSETNRKSPEILPKKQKKPKIKPGRSKILEEMGLSATPDYGEKIYSEYQDDNYATTGEAMRTNFVFNSEALLRHKGKLLRKFLCRYSYNRFGCLDAVRMFRLFHSKTGNLGVSDFKTFFQEVNVDMTARQLKCVINLIDDDGDGRIEVSEFLDWINKTSSEDDEVDESSESPTRRKRLTDGKTTAKKLAKPSSPGSAKKGERGAIISPKLGYSRLPKATQNAFDTYQQTMESLKIGPKTVMAGGTSAPQVITTPNSKVNNGRGPTRPQVTNTGRHNPQRLAAKTTPSKPTIVINNKKGMKKKNQLYSSVYGNKVKRPWSTQKRMKQKKFDQKGRKIVDMQF